MSVHSEEEFKNIERITLEDSLLNDVSFKRDAKEILNTFDQTHGPSVPNNAFKLEQIRCYQQLLTAATEHQHMELIGIMLRDKRGRFVPKYSKCFQETPLFVAVRTGNTEVVEIFLRMGSSASSGKDVTKPEYKMYDLQTAFKFACVLNDLEVLKFLMKCYKTQEPKRFRSKYGYLTTPLHVALTIVVDCWRKRRPKHVKKIVSLPVFVNLILSSGAEVNDVDDMGYTALHCFLKEVLKLIMTRRIFIGAETCKRITETVRILLVAGSGTEDTSLIHRDSDDSDSLDDLEESAALDEFGEIASLDIDSLDSPIKEVIKMACECILGTFGARRGYNIFLDLFSPMIVEILQLLLKHGADLTNEEMKIFAKELLEFADIVLGYIYCHERFEKPMAFLCNIYRSFLHAGASNISSFFARNTGWWTFIFAKIASYSFQSRRSTTRFLQLLLNAMTDNEVRLLRNTLLDAELVKKLMQKWCIDYKEEAKVIPVVVQKSLRELELPRSLKYLARVSVLMKHGRSFDVPSLGLPKCLEEYVQMV